MKMPTIVGIFIFISKENFMLSWVEHEKNAQLSWAQKIATGPEEKENENHKLDSNGPPTGKARLIINMIHGFLSFLKNSCLSTIKSMKLNIVKTFMILTVKR